MGSRTDGHEEGALRLLSLISIPYEVGLKGARCACAAQVFTKCENSSPSVKSSRRSSVCEQTWPKEASATRLLRSAASTCLAVTLVPGSEATKLEALQQHMHRALRRMHSSLTGPLAVIYHGGWRSPRTSRASAPSAAPSAPACASDEIRCCSASSPSSLTSSSASIATHGSSSTCRLLVGGRLAAKNPCPAHPRAYDGEEALRASAQGTAHLSTPSSTHAQSHHTVARTWRFSLVRQGAV